MRMRIKIMIGLFVAFGVLGGCEDSFDSAVKKNSMGYSMDYGSTGLVRGFAGGDGSEEDPYRIRNVEELELVRFFLDKHFKLMNDLDLGGITNFKPIGDKDIPFKGVFDGNGKKIKNLKIDRPTKDWVGFFGGIGSGGIVRNIGLEDMDVRGKDFVGGLLGMNEGMIEGSYAKGIVEGENVVGGFIGLNLKGVVRSSYATGEVFGKSSIGGFIGENHRGRVGKSYAKGRVEGGWVLGGFMGANFKGVVENSYVKCKVEGKEVIGGFMGLNKGTIRKSDATCKVKGEKVIGSFVAGNAGTIKMSYAKGEVVGTGSHVGGFMGSNHGTIENSSYEVFGKNSVVGKVQKGR